MALSLEWTEGMSEQEKKDFQELLIRNTIITKRFLEILNKREKLILEKETREDSFETPNWAFKQAYTNGRLQALREIRTLFRFLEEKGK